MLTKRDVKGTGTIALVVAAIGEMLTKRDVKELISYSNTSPNLVRC